MVKSFGCCWQKKKFERSWSDKNSGSLEHSERAIDIF